MKLHKPANRMTLRELLAHAEKCTRDLAEHVHTNHMNNLADFRDLNRPVRKRSHFPTLQAVQNSLQRTEQSAEEIMVLSDHLMETLQHVAEHARKEVLARA
jgi:hypothetical protein